MHHCRIDLICFRKILYVECGPNHVLQYETFNMFFECVKHWRVCGKMQCTIQTLSPNTELWATDLSHPQWRPCCYCIVLSGIVPFNVLAKLANVFLATTASVDIQIKIFRCAFWTLTLASQDLSVTLVCEVCDLEHGCFNRATFDYLKVCLLPLYK